MDYVIITAGVVVLLMVLDVVKCGEMRDKDTGAKVAVSCLGRVAIWLDKKNIL